MPRFSIEINGRDVCEIVREFSFIKPNFRIEGMQWNLSGDFSAHEYTLSDIDRKQLMYLSKEWFTWGDSYMLDINENQNELICLCIALAVDCYLAIAK